MAYSCWHLSDAERAKLLGIFPAAYPDVIAHHVTYAFGDMDDLVAPASTNDMVIVGEADDGKGVQALIVRINGTTHRPSGGTYHITWSLDRAAGRKPVESNNVIAEKGWTPVKAVSTRMTPAVFR